jgi:16S rRNA processing protein RimM
MLRDSPKSTRFASLGRIQKTHGKDGEVSLRLAHNGEDLQAATEVSSAIFNAACLWVIPPPQENRKLKVAGFRQAGDKLLVRFKGVNDRTAARELGGRNLLVECSDLDTELLDALHAIQEELVSEEEFGLGLEVYSDDYGHLGSVKEVLVTGANLVWVVDGGAHGEVLLPVIDDCILSVNEDLGTAEVKVMEGLIDEN